MFIKYVKKIERLIKLRYGLILTVFFVFFVIVSLLISAPMFPGNIFCKLIGISAVEYSRFLSAVFNGVFYGSILWLVFVVISRRFEEK